MGHEKHEEEIEEFEEPDEFDGGDERPDWEEDVVERKCRACRSTFFIKRGKKVRNCPFCGADQTRGGATKPLEDPTRGGRDPRQVKPWWPRRASRI